MDSLAQTLANIVTQLYEQDRKSLELITDLIGSVTRMEMRITSLENYANELHNKIYDLQTKVDVLIDDASDRIQ